MCWSLLECGYRDEGHAMRTRTFECSNTLKQNRLLRGVLQRDCYMCFSPLSANRVQVKKVWCWHFTRFVDPCPGSGGQNQQRTFAGVHDKGHTAQIFNWDSQFQILESDANYFVLEAQSSRWGSRRREPQVLSSE